MKRKLIALAGVLLFAACPLTACEKPHKSENAGLNMTEDDMPYGSTLVKNTELAVPMQYDRRFIDDDLAKTVAAYYHAIQEQDDAEFAGVLFPLYHTYEMETFYEGKYTDADILKNTHEGMQSIHGADFDFALIDILDLVKRQGVSNDLDSLAVMLNQLAADQNDTSFSEDMQSLIELQIDRYLCDRGAGIKKETDSVIADEKLYAVKYKDQWYLIYT